MFGGQVAPSGQVQIKRIPVQRAPWSWRLRNGLRWGFVWGWLCHRLAHAFSRLTGIPTMVGELAIRVKRLDGSWVDYGTVCYRVVTDAGVAYIVDDLDAASGSADISNWNYHGCGTDNTAEDVTDTALGAETTTSLNPNNTRATGTRSQPAANQYRSTGTLTFDGSVAVVEHGLFTQAATGGGTMLDRSVYSAVNVVSGESIQFAYTFTLTSGS